MNATRVLPFLLLFLILFASCSERKTGPFTHSIIPQPAQIETTNSWIHFDDRSIIYFQPDLESEANLLRTAISNTRGLTLETKQFIGEPEHTSSYILLKRTETDSSESIESYDIESTGEALVIDAPHPQGTFYGIQTLLQMIGDGEGPFDCPQVTVRDEPAFQHRGMLLDCCRHFFSTEVIKQYIDLLAYYKMNVLHWHLTEDQGWRIQIDAYPKLTEVGAWRTEADGTRYGGFYTKEEIRDIVSYAAERHITVIPEIELPGHSLAALAAYPHLACTDGPFEVTSEWGVFKEVYCAGSDSTFLFLENVLLEVMDLFPSTYIHIGGDESPKFRWKHCDKCKARMESKGLKDAHELQSYFIERIQTFLKTHDRELIGWDEILEGGLPKGSTVQSWRGMKGAIQAAQSGNYAILSPTSHCYLDYGLHLIDLQKIYSFDLIPKGLSEEETAFILGGECNMWTEHVPDKATLDRQIMPRMIGLAEVLWSYPEQRNYADFTERLDHHYLMLDRLGIQYGFEKIPYAFSTRMEGDDLVLLSKSQVTGLTSHYSISKNLPETSDPELKEYTHIPDDRDIRIRVWRGEKEYPDIFTIPLTVHEGLGHTTTSTSSFSPYYTAGGFEGLTDGIKGTLDFRDGRWQGYAGTDAQLQVDLTDTITINEIGAHFYQYNNAWIFPPSAVTISTSLDGKEFNEAHAVMYTGDLKDREKSIHYLGVDDLNTQARFIRFDLENLGPLPSWHDAAGSDSWIFIDELIIR